MIHVMRMLFPVAVGLSMVFVALWVSRGHSDTVRKSVINDLERRGHKQLHLDGIFIDARPAFSTMLSYRSGIISAKLKLYKVKDSANGKSQWQLFVDRPNGERRIVSPENLEQLISDVAATNREFSERVINTPAVTLTSVL